MRPLRLAALSPAQRAELDHRYRSAPEARGRIRALMVLLAAERRMGAAAIVALPRQAEATVRRWLVRYQAEGLAGLADVVRRGAAPKGTPADREHLLTVVRRRPRALGLPCSRWTGARLADYLAEQTGLRLSARRGYRCLAAAGIRRSRPQHTITSPDPASALKNKRSRRRATT